MNASRPSTLKKPIPIWALSNIERKSCAFDRRALLAGLRTLSPTGCGIRSNATLARGLYRYCQ